MTSVTFELVFIIYGARCEQKCLCLDVSRLFRVVPPNAPNAPIFEFMGEFKMKRMRTKMQAIRNVENVE